MKYTPHDYQKFATDFILTHPISAVILFLGAGKTVITLTAIEELLYDRFEVSKVLIVAPLRVAKVTWKDEITKWDHLQNLSFAVAVGSEKERMDALKQNADITIINRENLQWLIEKSKIPFEYDMVVLDELSSFKSWQSKRFRAFMKVRPKVKRVVGLTGTPAPNSLMDLFAEFKCLDMGQRLGRFITQYRTGYFMPDKMNGQIVYSYKLLPGAEDRIYSKISDITISMKAMDHLKMPELLSERYPVYMDEDETAKYESMKHDLILPYQDEDDITAANAAALSGKLCQMANGAVYSDNGEVVHIHDRKLDALEDLIEAAQGPLLLCYWYKHDLARIIKRLNQLYRQPTIENLKLMMDIFVFDTSDLTDALFEARLNNMLSRRDHLENFVKSLEANPKQFPDFGPRLAEIKAQTLIVWGRNDRFVPMDAGLRLLSGIAGSELHIFRDCGHWAQWEHADAFNQLVLNFLARP